jgi:16S rRNA G966 N2-methylase RsmD
MNDNIFKNVSLIPFIGSKWRYRYKLKDILMDNKFNFNDEYIIYDIFGGSGSLSLIFKCLFPNSKIYFNDYDEIITDKQGDNKIDISIDKTNKIMNEIKNICESDKLNIKNYKFENYKEINEILDKYKEELNDKMVKRMIESQICFNSRSLKQNQTDYFNKIRKTPLKHYYQYFKDVVIIHKDFEDILKDIKENYNNNNNVIILLDPPYLNTTMGDKYKMNYWKLSKYLNLLTFINYNQNYKYILFEGKESNIKDILDFISDLTNNKKIKDDNIKHYDLSKNEFVKLIY